MPHGLMWGCGNSFKAIVSTLWVLVEGAPVFPFIRFRALASKVRFQEFSEIQQHFPDSYQLPGTDGIRLLRKCVSLIALRCSLLSNCLTNCEVIICGRFQ